MNELSDYYEYTQPDSKWTAFFIAVHHLEDYEIYKIWNEYKDEIGKYVIAKEIALDGSHKQTNGEHFHFVAQMCIKTYNKLTKRFREKYKLNGSAKGGNAKQYGKVNHIKDTSRMIAYCMKDGDFQTNLTATEVEEYKKISFQKPQKVKKQGKSFTEGIVDELTKGVREDYLWEYHRDMDKICEVILKRLGETAKIFDKRQMVKFYYGVFNALNKSNRQITQFKEMMMSELKGEF